MEFSLWNELIMRRIIENSVWASYYFFAFAFVFEFDICDALFATRYSLHEYTGIHNRNRRVAACIAQWCEYLNWVNGKLHTKVNTVQKQLTCLAPFASALSRFILSFCSASATQQLPAPFAIWKSGREGAAIVVQHIHLAPFSVLFRCLCCCSWRTCESINERISDICSSRGSRCSSSVAVANSFKWHYNKLS